MRISALKIWQYLAPGDRGVELAVLVAMLLPLNQAPPLGLHLSAVCNKDYSVERCYMLKSIIWDDDFHQHFH